MPTRELDAVFYASEVPAIEFRDGVFHVGYDIRRCHFEFVMQPAVFLKAVLFAEEAIAKWRHHEAPRGNVRKLKGGHAARAR